MRHGTRRRLGMSLAAALAVHASGCGLILYPERRGQKDGKIDPTVAILDGLGLLLFLIPGVIVFVVDFHHGAIYLPDTRKKTEEAPRGEDARLETPDLTRWISVRVGPGPLDATTIRTVVGENTGRWIDLEDPRLVVADLGDRGDVPR